MELAVTLNIHIILQQASFHQKMNRTSFLCSTLMESLIRMEIICPKNLRDLIIEKEEKFVGILRIIIECFRISVMVIWNLEWR